MVKICCTCHTAPRITGSSKCRNCYNAYMRSYMAARYGKRRQWAIQQLGGCCTVCGDAGELEIDHIDRSQKQVNISKLILAKLEKLQAELAKCQLLCVKHHQEKTSVEMGVPHGGGVKGKHNCPCPPCRSANSRYTTELKRRQRLEGKNKSS